jgi:hypothetical protein
MSIENALTWDELADDYQKATGRTARIRPMEEVFRWAEKQEKKYFVDEEGYLYRRGRS